MGHDVEAYDDVVNVCCPIADTSHSLCICCAEGSDVGQACPERNVWSQSLPVTFIYGMYSHSLALLTCQVACDLSGMVHEPLV